PRNCQAQPGAWQRGASDLEVLCSASSQLSSDLGMIRQLFVAAALLLCPCIGHTADPSTDLGVKVSPATACDNGDGLGTPAMAAAAGFSHCVLNAEFTKVGGFFGNIANFIDGCGGTGTKIFQAYYAYSGIQVPCSRMTIESDSGTQV